MTIGAIQAANDSKSGKTLSVQVNGQWYSCKDFSLRDHIGVSITFESTGSEYPKGSGTMMYWINDYKFTNTMAANPQGPGTTIAQPAPPAPLAGKDSIIYLPMTSNVVAHAIAAGMIEKPQQIGAWAEHAFAAAKKVVEGPHAEVRTVTTDDEFDDEIPF